jgi:hypothetical protein
MKVDLEFEVDAEENKAPSRTSGTAQFPENGAISTGRWDTSLQVSALPMIDGPDPGALPEETYCVS